MFWYTRAVSAPLDDATETPESVSLDAEALFRLAAEALPNGVLVVGPDGRIALVNQAVERQFGYSRDELAGQPVDLLLDETLRATRVVALEAVMEAPEARPIDAGRDLLGRRRDGSMFPVEITLSPIRTARGTFVLAAVVDLTARRQIEDANSHALEGQLEFERLVAELSVRFINLPSDQVADAIREALRRIGEALSLDRCTFFRIEPDGTLSAAISWQLPGIPEIASPISGRERFPWALATALAGEVISFSSVDEIPNPVDRESYRAAGTRSTVTVPLSVAQQIVGAVGFHSVREERRWRPDEIHRLRVIASAFGSVLARQDSEDSLRKALLEVQRLRDRLDAENVYLRREVEERLGGIIVCESEPVGGVLEQIRQVAATDSTVLLLGETGTGKELFATQIHELSARHGRAMVRVNCSAIPSTLIESELFGREKGAYTGALARQIGRFELADHSTIFLDEIGELPLEIQVKLLRVLEERQIERLGSPRPIKVDVRIIAATNRDLERRITEGAFREDLFYRLNVFPIQVPPLRDRLEDIPVLVWRFVEEFSRSFGKQIDEISRENMRALQQYSWPGNIRELRNVVERAMIVATGPRLQIALPTPTPTSPRRSVRLADVETEHIRSVLESTGWRIRGVAGAAERLGLRPTTLETRLAKLGIKRPKLN